MNYYKKKLAVKNDEHISLPQIYNYRSLSLNKEITSFTDVSHKKYSMYTQFKVIIQLKISDAAVLPRNKLYISFIYSNQIPSDRYSEKPQHMRNIKRKNQMLKLQLKRVFEQIKKVSPPRLQYETLEEIYFIRYKKIT